tara:strand:- start:4 stop:678 length:675 start_codon:yes stop_codon:yes gene_type:complete
MSWINTHPQQFSDCYNTDTHGGYGALQPVADEKAYHFTPLEWQDVLVALKGTLKEKETHFVRKVKQAGGFVSVERGVGSDGDDYYYIHIPGKIWDCGSSIEYKCPFCRERYKKNGFPYFMSKPHTHVHGALGFETGKCLVSPHCPNPSLSGNYQSDFVFFGMKEFLIQVYVMNMEKEQNSWKRSEKSFILDHDAFPNDEDYTPESEFSYIASFFSQENLSEFGM